MGWDMQGLFVDWQQSRLDRLSVKVILSGGGKHKLTDGVSITKYSNAWKNNDDTSLEIPIYL